MVAIIGVSTFIFLFYFLASFNTTASKHRWVFVGLFLLSTFVLRSMISPELNKDYFGYFEFFEFKLPDNFLGFVLGEPYVKIIYAIFSVFTSDKQVIFLMIYWFNLIVVNGFFVWMLFRTDVQMWKKIVLFSFFYFLFAFVLIRNSAAYILFALFFYYAFRNIKLNWVLFTPFIHISSVAVLVTFFHQRKHYYLLFVLFSVAIAVSLLYVFPALVDSFAIEATVSKINTYSVEAETVSVFHKVYVAFISFVVAITAVIYKKQILHPIILTTIILYYISFLINPIVGFRFAPYLLFAILFFNFEGTFNSQFTRVFNLMSFMMIPYFVYTLIDTHYL